MSQRKSDYVSAEAGSARAPAPAANWQEELLRVLLRQSQCVILPNLLTSLVVLTTLVALLDLARFRDFAAARTPLLPDARITALTTYWMALSGRSKSQIDAIRRLTAQEEARKSDWAADRSEAGQERAAVTEQSSLLANGVNRVPALAGALAYFIQSDSARRALLLLAATAHVVLTLLCWIPSLAPAAGVPPSGGRTAGAPPVGAGAAPAPGDRVARAARRGAPTPRLS